jgi:hypothetical protein
VEEGEEGTLVDLHDPRRKMEIDVDEEETWVVEVEGILVDHGQVGEVVDHP